MAKLMLVNPRRRPRRKAASKRRRPTVVTVRTNPKRRRRRRTMSALQKRYFGRRLRRNPVRRIRRNPVSRSASRASRRAHGDLSLQTITSGDVLQTTVFPAALGAVGAVALDALYAVLPIPEAWRTGQFAAPIKAMGVLGAGALATQFIPRQRAMIETAVAASLTIMAYNFVKAQVQAAFPALNLGEYVDGVGYTGAGQVIPDYALTPALTPPPGVGEYISGAPGSYSSAWNDTVYGDEVF